jgi:polysaccharide export outer membrane protein
MFKSMLFLAAAPAQPGRRVGLGIYVAGLALALSACSTSAPELPNNVAGTFRPAEKSNTATLLSKEELALLEESVDPIYLLGSGDAIRLQVFGRPEISGRHVVGPDGRVTLPLAGDVKVTELSRDDARALVEQRLKIFFTHPHVTLAVEEYTSNQVTVLGRVERAGVQKFAHPPTLIEVLAGAGAMPILDKQASLTRCAIVRGRDKLIWVDLKALLNGDPHYNLRMKKGDVVFLPDSSETAVYVLGQVAKPGAYRLTQRMTVLDALAQAGGLSEDSRPSEIGLYRAGVQKTEVISFAELIAPNRALNYSLEDGDVIFLPRNKMADFGYLMKQLGPGLSVLNFAVALRAASK